MWKTQLPAPQKPRGRQKAPAPSVRKYRNFECVSRNQRFKSCANVGTPGKTGFPDGIHSRAHRYPWRRVFECNYFFISQYFWVPITDLKSRQHLLSKYSKKYLKSARNKFKMMLLESKVCNVLCLVWAPRHKVHTFGHWHYHWDIFLCSWSPWSGTQEIEKISKWCLWNPKCAMSYGGVPETQSPTPSATKITIGMFYMILKPLIWDTRIR